MVDHDYKPKGFILKHGTNIINHMSNISHRDNICVNAALDHG